jgi:hypothetical protein
MEPAKRPLMSPRAGRTLAPDMTENALPAAAESWRTILSVIKHFHHKAAQNFETRTANGAEHVDYPASGRIDGHHPYAPGQMAGNPYGGIAPPCVSPAVHRLARARVCFQEC